MPASESHSRSLTKTITYRIAVLAGDGVVVLALTGRFDLAITIIVLRNAIAMLLYYIHERAWSRIHWGRSHNHPVSS